MIDPIEFALYIALAVIIVWPIATALAPRRARRNALRRPLRPTLGNKRHKRFFAA